MSVAVATEEKFVTSVVERRQNSRQTVQSNATVTVLDDETSFPGTLSNVSDGGAQLRLDRRVPVSSLLKIECVDFFLLGEVVYCQADRGNWVVGVNVEHGLYGLQALADAVQSSWLD